MSYSHDSQTDRRRRQPLTSTHSLSHLRNDDYGTTFTSTRNKKKVAPASLSRSILSADMSGCELMKLNGWMDNGWQLRVFLLSLIFYSGSGFLHTEHPEIGPVASTSF